MENAVERRAAHPVGSGIRWTSAVVTLVGLGLVVVLHWMVFFWVNTEATMGSCNASSTCTYPPSG